VTFAWQGFLLDVPEDFDPVCLTGDRASGYARLEGDHGRAIQLRWMTLKGGGSLRATTSAYLARLERDARRQKLSFSSTIDDDGRYRYSGSVSAWGAGVPLDERVFLIEASGKRKDSVLPLLRRALETLAPTDRWCVLGLAIRLPQAAKLRRSKFLAGRTELEFDVPGVVNSGRIVAVRVGYAGRLLDGRSLSDWCRAALGWTRPEVVDEDPVRVRLRKGGKEAVARFDEAEDRIVLVSSTSRRIEWKPRWDWIDWDAGYSEGEVAPSWSASADAVSSAMRR